MKSSLIIFALLVLVSSNACAQLLYQKLNVKTLKLPNESVSSALYLNASNQIKSHATVSDTELGYLDGVSSAIQTQLGTKQATLTGAATTIASSDLTVSRAVVSNGSGKIAVATTTAAEIGFVNGVTSAIQTQIDAKQATITGGATTIATSNLTVSRALVSDGSGKVAAATTTSSEIGFVNGVTSAIQTQLDAKVGTVGVTKPVVYSFLVGTTGTVSNEIGNVINGDCTNATPRVCTFNAVFTGTPNCMIGSTQTNSRFVLGPTSSTTVSIYGFDDVGVASPAAAVVICHGAGV